MPVNERNYLHIRLSKKNAKKIVRITKQTKRSANTEANIAVEEYKPKPVVYRDNGN